jgi:hypothetical protein
VGNGTGTRFIRKTRSYHWALVSTSDTVGEKWWKPVTAGAVSVSVKADSFVSWTPAGCVW